MEEKEVMTRKWRILEKAIATLLLLYGAYMLFVIIYSKVFVAQMISERISGEDQTSLSLLIRKAGLYLTIYSVAVLSGIALLRSKMIGWIGALLCSLAIVVIALSQLAKTIQTSVGPLVIPIVEGLIFTCIFIMLCARPFREKHLHL